MDFGIGLLACMFLLTVFASRATVAIFSGPEDTSVLQGNTATLNCRDPAYTGPGITNWREGSTTFANEGGVFGSTKYTDNFEVITSSSTPTTQLDLQINNAQVSDEGTYTCEITPGIGEATFKVEIEGEVPTITIDGDSSGNPVRLTAGVQSTLRCTARNFRPAVNLQWFKDNVQITTGISEDVPTDNGDDTSTTSGTWTIIPTIPDDGGRLECRTTGQEVATAKTGVLTLNVQFVPVVTVGYSGGQITCSSDANPLAATHQIIRNGTDVLKTFTNRPGSAVFKPLLYCTEISCNATNTIGTGTDTFAVQICPVYVESTSPVLPKPSDPPTAPASASPVDIAVGLVVACLIVAFVAALGIVLWRRHQTRAQGKTKTGEKDVGAYVVPHRQDNDMSPLPVNDQASPGQDHHHANDIPLDQITTAVVYESIPNEVVVEPEASNDVEYGNVGPDLSFSRDLVVIENELGRGQFGRVLLGKALGIQEAGKETKVAVKTLKEGADRQARMELLAELELMKTVGSHPNVVKLLGYCAEKDPVYVIVEYLAKGDLKDVLMEYRDKDPGTGYSNLPGLSKSLSRTLVKFARDVANGMAFISSQKCVHRDLAARNVLVGDDMVCKVSDFGLARDVMNIRIYQRESHGPLPMRWMALESILDDVYTTESDVWSFGILLWEIVTLGARPYPLMNTNAMVSQLQQGYRMPKPQHCKKQLYSMMCSCWKESPKDRPSFQSLYQQLDDMVSEDKDYITIHKLDESIYEVTMVEDTNEKL